VFGFTTTKPRDFDNLDWLEAKTADDGSFRLNVMQNSPAFFWIRCNDYAVAQQVVEKNRGDLGEIRLADGQRITGRILSAEGKPIPGIAVNAYYVSKENDPLRQFQVLSGIRRGVTTDQEGRFTFAPLPDGEYRVAPENELTDHDDKQSTVPLPGVFIATKVTLQSGTTPSPVEIQGIPHIVFRTQWLTSSGKKIRGSDYWISGQMDKQRWSTNVKPEREGNSVVQIPHGLQDVRVSLITNEHSSLGYRRGPGKPIEKYYGGLELGTLNDDVEGFEIIRYKAPIVVIKAVDTEGRPIRHFELIAAYTGERRKYGGSVSCERQDDIHFRTSQMLPDEEVKFQVTATGYVMASETLKLAEGETKELAIKMKAVSPAVDAVKSVVDGAAELLKELKPKAPEKQE
jgi:hypothetical protein